MRILGIHSGHCATACLYEDGKVIATVSEERFTRKKNQSGYPGRAVQWLVDEYGIVNSELDSVAVAELLASMDELHWHGGSWESFASGVSRIIPARVLTSEALVKPYTWLRTLGQKARRDLAEHLAPYGIPESKIEFVEHHTCHAHAAYWLDFHRTSGDTLVVTLDNTGDGLCSTINVANGAKFERIQALQSLRSIGMLYTAITRFLGMTPVEHEYKVMGLAPYASQLHAERVCEILRRHIDLSPDNLRFTNRRGLGESALVRCFRNELAGLRFDNIAGGVQLLIEDLVIRYLRAWQRKTGLRKLVVGGGVFMNVKMNMLVNQMEEFDEVFFLPSCGDEHNATGAALKCAWDRHREAGQAFDPQPLGPLDLGPEYSNEDVEKALQEHKGRLRWRLCDDLEHETARALAEGKIVGRMRGRMEFGARSLGNRSIIARGDSLATVHKINSAIKMRDFWMPFAPSVLRERGADYVVNPNNNLAPYMNLAFQSTRLARREVIAGLHPYDHSCRPQLVEADWCPRYHKLLKHYEDLTGAGGILNTSFNLHGDPVVCTPADALYTYLESDLDLLTIEDYMIWAPERLAGSQKRTGVAEWRVPSVELAIAL